MSPVLADLVLPPDYTVRIELDPDKGLMCATVTVFHDGTWVGEVGAMPSYLELPGKLQDIVDHLTKRGVRVVTTPPSVEQIPPEDPDKKWWT